MTVLSASASVRALTKGPRHHFFGYYDKSPWDASGRRLLAMEASFMDRAPCASDPLIIGIIDTANDQWNPIAETRAWNWQQGCMLQWLGNGSTGDLIFNDLREGRFVSRIVNIHTGRERLLDRPIYAVNPAGTEAVSLSFSRLHHQRRGYGYDGVADANRSIAVPEDDGLYRVDLSTGESRMILSIAEAVEFERQPAFEGKFHRFNHAQFSRDGNRFAFLHRYQTAPERGHLTRLLTIGIDGSALWTVSDDEMVSHYDWGVNGRIIAWARRREIGDRYFLFRDQTDQIRIVGEECFDSDGHCSFSPDGEWILTDTYPDDDNHRVVALYHPERRQRINIGRFHSMPLPDEIRCDLHPRWGRCGRKVCIDSTHEGTRQMYIIDLEEVL